MSYARVIPRDLFNEADLLKCYGRLVILLQNLGHHHAELSEGSGAPFDIQQDSSSGAITVANLPFAIAGERYRLMRPLNSRQPWPLYAVDDEDEEVAVFSRIGEFSAEFLQLITRGHA